MSTQETNEKEQILLRSLSRGLCFFIVVIYKFSTPQQRKRADRSTRDTSVRSGNGVIVNYLTNGCCINCNMSWIFLLYVCAAVFANR